MLDNIMIDRITDNFRSIDFVSKKNIVESQSLNLINRVIYLIPMAFLLTVHLITSGLIGAPILEIS